MSGRFEGETDPRALNAPILEFDPTREAIIEATRVPYIAGRDGEQREMPPRVVLCYFQDVIEKVVREHGARPLARLRSEIGPNDVYLLEREVPIALAHPGVGAPRAGISGVRCSPHTFRHTFATRYLLLAATC